jgi:Tfp pilus assembly protein PilF
MSEPRARAQRLLDRGNTLARGGDMAAAERSFAEAVAADESWAEAHFNLGFARRSLGRAGDAASCWRRALELKPALASARINLGGLLLETGDAAGAEEQFRAVLANEPESVPALVNLGNALRDRGDAKEAIAAYRRAIALQPGLAAAHGNLALALRDLGELSDSEAAYRRAIALQPDYATARKDLGLLLLLTGRWREGWDEYRWRWKTRWHVRRKLPCPAWTGGGVRGKSVLLHAEQGLGDTIMFCRLAAAVAALGADVTLEAQPELVRLLAGLKGPSRITARGGDPPQADAEAPLMDLPFILKLEPDTVPAETPYLAPDPGRARRWRDWLGEPRGLTVGLVWQGNPRSNAELGRSPPLAAFSPLADIPGIRLIALQKGPGREQLAALPPGMTVATPGEDFDSGPDAFLDTAALMQSLDLVVSSDTAPAHLAGALGRPVWIALRHTPDWRWGLDRRDSPWYPTARLFRQPRLGDWGAVFQGMAGEMQTLGRG